MGLKVEKKKEYLQKIIRNYLLTSLEIMNYLKAVADTKKSKLVCNKSIKNINQALVFVNEVKHIEVLEYLYGLFIGNNVIQHSISGNVINSKKLREYDTDKGFDDFLKMVKEQKEQALEREQKRKESLEALKKAKEMGKKVEMVYDPQTKTTKPMIIEDKPNS